MAADTSAGPTPGTTAGAPPWAPAAVTTSGPGTGAPVDPSVTRGAAGPLAAGEGKRLLLAIIAKHGFPIIK